MKYSYRFATMKETHTIYHITKAICNRLLMVKYECSDFKRLLYSRSTSPSSAPSSSAAIPPLIIYVGDYCPTITHESISVWNGFHFTIFLVQWASFECVNKNPFYQWFLVEMRTTSWRSLSLHIPASPLFRSRSISFSFYNSSNAYFNEFSHLRYESALQTKWLICVHMKSFFQHWCICVSVCLCVAITVGIDESLPCKSVQKICPKILSSAKNPKVYSWFVIVMITD